MSFAVGANLVGLLGTLFMVRHVAPEEFGRLALALGALMLTNAIISLGADSLIAINKNKMTPEAYSNFRTAYRHLALMVFTLVQIAALAIWLATDWLNPLVLLVPLMAVTKFFVTIASIEYVMEQRAIAYGLVQLVTSLVAAIVTVLLVLLVSPNAESRIISLIFADLLLLMMRYGLRLEILRSWNFNRAEFARIARFGAPLMLSVVPAYLLNEADKLVVAKEMDLIAVGIYGAACTIAGFLLSFITALLNSLLPRIMCALKDYPERSLSISLNYASRFCIITALFGTFFLFSYSLLAIHLLPARYSEAIPVVYVLSFMMLCRAFYIVIGTVTDYFEMSNQKLVGVMLGAIVTVGVTTFATRTAGLFGAAIGVGLGYAVLAAWLTLSLARRQSDNNQQVS